MKWRVLYLVPVEIDIPSGGLDMDPDQVEKLADDLLREALRARGPGVGVPSVWRHPVLLS